MAGNTITTGSHPKLLWPGVHAVWGQMYAQHADEYTSLYDIKDSNMAYETDVQVTGFGLAPIKPDCFDRCNRGKHAVGANLHPGVAQHPREMNHVFREHDRQFGPSKIPRACSSFSSLAVSPPCIRTISS